MIAGAVYEVDYYGMTVWASMSPKASKRWNVGGRPGDSRLELQCIPHTTWLAATRARHSDRPVSG